ncbi:lymphocyte antigen 6B-like [Dasypus novemcinctus]|uniref:lymphocyte antigen 6B-like n=1 Tax=Dasypus novemcinctus TaxID=9361 RepID=UPI000329044A
MAGANMKALTLLAVLLCLEEGWAIKCHSCTNPNGVTCQNETECPPSATACHSVTARYKMKDVQQTGTEKYCVPSCNMFPAIKSREPLLEMQVYHYCCNTDLCNGAGDQGPGDNTVGLMLVASVLTTLLGASV